MQSKSMLQEILNSSASKIQRKKQLKQYSDYLFKAPSQFTTDLQDCNLAQTTQKLTAISYGLTLDVIFNSISINECFQFCDSKGPFQTPVLNFLEYVLKSKTSQKYIRVSAALDRHTLIQKALVILAGCTRYCIKENTQESLPKIVPRIIRICAHIIQKFLTLKNEPSKDKSDRIQADKPVLQNCEKWVADSLNVFFDNLPIPHNPINKYLTLLGIGDLMGALIEVQRQNTLTQSILTALLQKTLVPFVKKYYSLAEIHKSFVNNLKNKKYWNPIHKIQIPEEYSLDMNSQQLNTQAYCYLILEYLEQGSALYSKQQLLKFLAVATSQILCRPYELKIRLIQKFELILKSNEGTTKNGKDWDYPTGLLLFYFWHYEKQHYQAILKNIRPKDTSVFTNMLISLKMILTDGLGSQQNQYILTVIKQEQLKDPNVYVLLRQISNEGILNHQCSTLFLQIVKQLLDTTQKQKIIDLGRELIRRKLVDEKTKKQLEELIA